MMQELNQLSVQANLVIYTAAIGACGRGRQWSEALHLFDEMKDPSPSRKKRWWKGRR